MQRYWSMREYYKDGRLIRGYGFCKDGNDAIKKAKQQSEANKEHLERVWIAFLESEYPEFILVYGQDTTSAKTQPLDNASKGIAKEFKNKKGKKGKRGKPEKIEKVTKALVQEEKVAPYWPEYRVMFSDTFLKERSSAIE